MCSVLQDSLKICKVFVLGRIRNLLWPGLAKEEFIAHIPPILSHHFCAPVIAVSEKNCVNLGYMWPVYSKLLFSFFSAFAMPLHRREHEIRVPLHYCPTHLLPELPLAPAWGGSSELAFLRKMLQVQGKRVKGMARSRKWQQKTRAGQRKERWWQARDKGRANLKAVLQKGPAVWAYFANIALKGYKKPFGKRPSWTSLIPVVMGNS